MHVKSDVRLFYFCLMNESITFTSRIHQLDYLMNVRYLEVTQDIIEKLGGSLKVRLVCTVNDSVTFQCGLMALSGGNAYITLNKKYLKKLGVELGDEVYVKLVKDESKYGMEMSSELSEWLTQDPDAKKKFDELSPGKQRYIIYYVNGVKSPLKRMERTSLMMENLKRMTGKFSFRFLLGKEE